MDRPAYEDEWEQPAPLQPPGIEWPGGWMATPPAEDEPTEDHNSWDAIDLGPYLDGSIVRPEPSIGIKRRDGLRMLYPGKEHACIGEMESGKSWFALACVMAEFVEGHHVVYIHFEESDPGDSIERLRLLGAYPDDIRTLFHFYAPERAARPEDIAALVAHGPTLVILDGVNEGMSLHKQKINDTEGAAEFRRRLVKPFTKAGAAILALDHVVKDRETRGRYQIGSVHKGNAINGVQIILECMDPFGRGMRGTASVHIGKDRPGYLRRKGRATKVPGLTLMGVLVIDDSQLRSPDLFLGFFPPKDDKPEKDAAEELTKKQQLMFEVSKLLVRYPVGLSGRQITDLIEGRTIEVRKAVAALVDQGYVLAQDGPKRSVIHTNIKLYGVVSSESVLPSDSQ